MVVWWSFPKRTNRAERNCPIDATWRFSSQACLALPSPCLLQSYRIASASPPLQYCSTRQGIAGCHIVTVTDASTCRYLPTTPRAAGPLHQPVPSTPPAARPVRPAPSLPYSAPQYPLASAHQIVSPPPLLHPHRPPGLLIRTARIPFFCLSDAASADLPSCAQTAAWR